MKNKLLAIESGGDWADASVDYLVNLTDRQGSDLVKEYRNNGGFHGNDEKWFPKWAIDKGYCREPLETELEVCFDES